MKVFELADELGLRSIDVLDACDEAGIRGLEAGSELDAPRVDDVRRAFGQLVARQEADAQAAVSATYAPAPPPPVMIGATLAPHEVAAPPAPYTPHPGSPVPPGTPLLGGNHGKKGKPPTHPLVSKAILHMVLGHVVPCVGIYFWISSVVLAGKGRRQIRWSGGRYGGDTAALVIQIVFWVEVALLVFYLAYAFTLAKNGVVPAGSTP